MIKFFCFTPLDINRATLNAFDEFVNDEGMGGQACGYVIGAGDGVESNIARMERLYKDTARWNILTNQIVLLDHKYCWDNAFAVPERAYIFEPMQEKFYHIQELTDREIREYNNIMKMYLNGGLEKWEELKTHWQTGILR